MDLNRYQSLKEVVVLDAVNDPDELKEVVSDYVCDMVRKVKLEF